MENLPIQNDEELTALRLKSVITTRKYVNTLLQASGQKVAEGIPLRTEPKTQLEITKEHIRKRLIETGTIPA